MKLKSHIITIFLVLIVGLVYGQGIKKSNIRVLVVAPNPNKVFVGGYAGPNASKRQDQLARTRGQEFKKLLDEYFTIVDIINSDSYDYTLSNNYDVTIMDDVPKAIDTVDLIALRVGSIIHDGAPFMYPRYFPDHFNRAIICIGQITDNLTNGITTKLVTQCHCLEKYATHIKKEHAIFNSPIKISMPYEKIHTLQNFRKYYSGVNLSDSIEGWNTQTESAADEKGYWIGQIMTGLGFEDSPDCEYISGGNSIKDITGMALGRNANIFHWGFSASPDFMTESAKLVFVNTVFYMAQFNGKKPITQYRSDSRLWADELCYRKTHKLINHSTNNYDQATFNTSDSTLKYYTENYPYFYSKGMFLNMIVDKDVKLLGIANNNVKLLDKCVEMLESGKDTDLAFRILFRYTDFRFSTAKEWRNWLEKHKKYLFFTELGGYKFMINTYDYPDLIKTSSDLIKTSSDSIITSDGFTNEENNVLNIKGKITKQKGETYLLELTLEIAKGWHIYADMTNMFVGTQITFIKPEGVKLLGKLSKPKAQSDESNNKIKIYNGESVFKQKLVFDKSDLNGKEIECIVYFQACDDYVCKEPTTKRLMIRI